MTTIGVAIAIPEPHGAQLRRHRASFGDLQAETIPTHVTLVPPTDLARVSLDVVDEHLGDVAEKLPAFSMHLRGTATFRPTSPVVFVAMAEGISSCELIAGSVRSGPLQQELDFPYHPHVTIAHDLPDSALDLAFETLADFECRFDVNEFQLYVHDDDGVWRQRRAYALSPPVAAASSSGSR